MDLKQLHYDVFAGKTDYIPLLIKIDNPGHGFKSDLECKNNPQYVIDNYHAQYGETLKLKSDIVPIIESDFTMTLVPSIFGASFHEVGGTYDPKPLITDIRQTYDFGEIDIYGGFFEKAMSHLRYLKANKPDEALLQITRFPSPLDLAVVLRGGDFYSDLLIEPEASLDFMKLLTDISIRLIKVFKNEIGQPLDESCTLRGLHFKGLRLTGDAVVNLSPAMIKDIMCPVYKGFEDEFGSVMLHYCTVPSPAFHVVAAFAEGGGVTAVDNWQGLDTLIDLSSDDLYQDKVAMCFDISKDSIFDIVDYMQHPFFSNVKRRGGRGLTASVHADNLYEGKRLYDIWQNYFAKN